MAQSVTIERIRKRKRRQVLWKGHTSSWDLVLGEAELGEYGEDTGRQNRLMEDIC
jgi:hypothetical protein